MERETKRFKTKSGKDIVMHTYLTGRESREIRDCYLESVEINAGIQNENNGAKLSGIKASSISRAEDKSIIALIVSVNGKIENILETVLDLPELDFNEVVAEINKITSEKKGESDTLKV